MCGILGYIRYNTKNRNQISAEQATEAFRESSLRGREASGLYTPETGVLKGSEPGEDFCHKINKKLKIALASDVFIGHTRTATTGFWGGASPASNNDNNHPHEGKKFVLVHNGYFSHIPPVKNYKYRGNCDSELALSYVETFGIKRGIELMSKDDKFSLVIFDKAEGKMYWYRESNPLIYCVDNYAGLILFGSTTDIALAMCAMRDIAGFNVEDASPPYSTMENELYTLAPGTGCISHERIQLRLADYALQNMPEAKQLDIKVAKSITHERRGDAKFEVNKFMRIGTSAEIRGDAFVSADLSKMNAHKLNVFITLKNGLPIYQQLNSLTHNYPPTVHPSTNGTLFN
jgi:asparagine synthetase B (glutamine-hydrolysing)